jgi:rhodanese-related sulfurtransferase
VSRVDDLLTAARTRLERVAPASAYAEVEAGGAVLVDIRPHAQRQREGEAAGSLVVERNVLEWRADPTSDARLPEAVDDDVRWIVLCQEGYTSSLAAAALLDLGLRRSTDVVGGFAAWRAAGLPTRPGGTPALP